MPRNRLKTALNAGNNVEFLELENRLSLSSPSNRLERVNPTNFKNFFGSSIQSPTTMQMHQNANQQLWGCHSDLTNSNVIGSPQFRGDAFSKQSESFIERSSMASFSSDLPSATSVAMEPSTFSGWGSPDGKLDWSIRCNELNKMRKSYSFGFRNRNSTSSIASALRHESWINSLVKDAPTMEFDQYCVEDQLQCHNPDAVLSLPEHLYMEQ